jgi:integrase
MAIKKVKRGQPWLVYWRNPFTGRQESKVFAKKADAEKHDSLVKHRLKHDRESFRPQAGEQAQAGPEMTVAQAVYRYLAAKRRMAESTKREALYHLKTVLPLIGHVPAVDMRARHMRLVQEDQEGRDLAQATIHRRLSIIRTALSWAAEKELIEFNPIAGFRIEEGQHAQIPPPSISEGRRLWEAAPDHIRRVILLGATLGMRPGPCEMFKQRWAESFFPEDRVFRVWSAKKNRGMQYRDIRLPEDVLAWLSMWHAEDQAQGVEHVVHWKGQPVKSIRTAWAKVLKAAGIGRRIRPYDLRHALGTHAVDGGADDKAVAGVMGHADMTMLNEHYKHTTPRQTEEVMAAAPRFFVEPTSAAVPGPESVHTACAYKSGVSGPFLCEQPKKVQ